MTLQEMLKAVANLSPDEVRQLREYLEQIEDESVPSPVSMTALEQVFADLRAGFSDADLDELEWAMNVEYIEPPEKIE